MAVLYRKYRPQTFAEVLNQKSIIKTLKNQVKSGSIAHAYLFTGSRGVGKTSIARILAKAANCEKSQNYDGDACGVCNICKAIEQGNFIDLVEIDAASNTSVENVRDLIEHVRFAPSIGKYKVFIIDEVHMLSKSAFNALLKTLEEPPKHAIFVLATTEINKVPPTIISRTQKFDFKALSQSDILSQLEKICSQEKVALSKQILELVAQNAEGSVRDALSLLDKVMTLGEDASLEECQQMLGITDIALCENLLQIIALGKAQEVPVFLSSLNERGLDYEIFNKDFLEFLRKALISKISKGDVGFGLSVEREAKIKQLTEGLSAQDLIFTIRLFLKSYKDIQNSPDPQVPLLIAGIEAAVRKAVVQQSAIRPEEHVSVLTKSSNQSHQTKTTIEQPMVESIVIEEVPEIEILTEESGFMQRPQMDMAEVQSLWPQVIAKVKKINGPLASLLKNCPLVNVQDGRIVLQVKFNFDKQSLESPKNSLLISGFVEEISGKKIGILAEVKKTESASIVSQAESLGEALKVFGGELID